MNKTKIFFDTEFTGLHQGTTLISIGFVSDCGKTFYAELTDYDQSQIDDWLKTNVIDNLKNQLMLNNSIEVAKVFDETENTRCKCDTKTLKLYLTQWFTQFEEIEIWSDCLSYDWVLFNQIFGHAFNIPKNVYYIPFDICTLFYMKGIDPDINREDFAQPKVELTGTKDTAQELTEESKEIMQKGFPKHNALWDAKIIKACFEKLMRL